MISQYLSDCLRAEIAFLLFVPLFIFPGYILGNATDMFCFRSQGYLTRVCLSLGFSVAITPILLFLLWRVSIQWATAGYCLSSVLGVGLLLKNHWRMHQIRIPGVLASIGAAWMLIVLFSLVDLPIGHGLYVSSVANPDHSYRVEIIAQLARSFSLPPSSPFLAGNFAPVVLRYHYFWFLVCGLIPHLTGWRIGARDALNGSIIWIGYLLLASLALYWKFIFNVRDPLRKSIASIPVLLLGGLQGPAFFAAFLLYRDLKGYWKLPYPTLTWIEGLGQITYWLDSLLWVPNHVAAVLACLAALLALYRMHQVTDLRQQVILTVVAGFSLASSVGLSVFVCIPFFAFLGVLCAFQLIKFPGRRLSIELASGLFIAALLIAPYLWSIRAPAGTPFPLGLSIRPSSVANMLALHIRGITPLGKQLLNLALEPLVFFYELGILAVIAIWAFAQCKVTRSQEERGRDKLIGLFALVTIVIALFVNSNEISEGTNDLGWRAPLGALFFLVFYGVWWFDGWRNNDLQNPLPQWARKFRPVLVLLVVIGFATTLTEFMLLRFYELANRTSQAAAHTEDLRTALDFLRHNTAPEAIVQLNPEKDDSTYSGLYMERGTALRAGRNVFNHYDGTNPDLVRNTETGIEPIFDDIGLVPDQVQQRCSALRIDYVVVQPGDRVFIDSRSWIWQLTPLYANQSVRIYKC